MEAEKVFCIIMTLTSLFLSTKGEYAMNDSKWVRKEKASIPNSSLYYDDDSKGGRQAMVKAGRSKRGELLTSRQFHQHFMSIFCTDIFCAKKLQNQSVTR